MKHEKIIGFALQFHKFVTELGIPPIKVVDLIHLAEESAQAVDDSSVPENSYRCTDLMEAVEKYQKQIESIAEEFNCEVDWPGRWPYFQKKNEPSSNQRLPEKS